IEFGISRPKPRRNRINTIAKVNKTVPAKTPIIPVILITRPIMISLFAITDLSLSPRKSPFATKPRFSAPARRRAASLDHLVGAGEQCRRHVEAERHGRLEVDHKLILGWRLHREVAWLLALKDAVDVACGAPVLIDAMRAVRHQATGVDEDTSGVDGGQAVAGR